MTVKQEQVAQNATSIEGVDLNVAAKPIHSGFATRKLKHRWLVTVRFQFGNKLNSIETRCPALEQSHTR
jgi:hypothetical protein